MKKVGLGRGLDALMGSFEELEEKLPENVPGMPTEIDINLIDVNKDQARKSFDESKLKELSDGAQVLCITHSPQIASLADTHLCIRKKESDGRAESEIQELDEGGRISEIARIIGGVSVTETQRDAAREMIENNQ